MNSYFKKLLGAMSIFVICLMGRAHAAPPVVDAGPDRTVLITDTVALEGAVSDDGLPFGVLSSTWSKAFGPGMVTFDTPYSTSTIVHFSSTGVYTIMLSATDGAQVSMDTMTVTVNGSTQAVNQAPVVDAGPNQTITLPVNAVILTGSATDDGQPFGVLHSSWTKASGPGTVTFGSPLTPITTAQFSGAGTYVLQLWATDGALVSVDTMTVTVNGSTQAVNQAPVVDAGPNQTITLPVNAVILTGSATDDGQPFGVLHSSWTKASGPGTVTFGSPLTPITTAQFSGAGTYVLQLWATDGALVSVDSVTVVVNGSTSTPTTPLDKDNVIQPGTKTIVRGNDINSAKMVFRTENAGRVTFYVYERSMGMKKMEFDATQGDNEILIRDIKSQLNLSWGIYHVTIRQNGNVLKKNIPLALIP